MYLEGILLGRKTEFLYFVRIKALLCLKNALIFESIKSPLDLLIKYGLNSHLYIRGPELAICAVFKRNFSNWLKLRLCIRRRIKSLEKSATGGCFLYKFAYLDYVPTLF